MALEIKIIQHQSDDYKEMVNLRQEILRTPLKLQFSQEELAAENNQIHIGAYDENVLLGCLVLVKKDSKTLKMRQVAVANENQGNGIGSRLVSFSELWAVENKFCRIELHARETAVKFYEDLSYLKIDEPFMEVGIKHYKMFKDWCG